MLRKIKNLTFAFLILCVAFLCNENGILAYAQSSIGCWVTTVGHPGSDKEKPNCNNSTTSGGSGSTDSSGFVYYCQMSPDWNPNGSTCIANAGCGPTSFAMVMSTFGVKITPTDVDSVFQQNGWRSGCDGGSSWGKAIDSDWFAQQGFTHGPNVALDLDAMKQWVSQGYLIIASADNYPCQGCNSESLPPGSPVSHVFIIDDADPATKRIRVRDPNNCNSATGEEKKEWMWVSLNENTDYPNTSPFSAQDAAWIASYPVKKS